jgi:hypothetical protein
VKKIFKNIIVTFLLLFISAALYMYFSALLIHSEEDLTWENNDWEGVYLIEVNVSSIDDFINRYNRGNYCRNIKNKLQDISNTKIIIYFIRSIMPL